MKTKEEIEQLAEQRFPTNNLDRFKSTDFASLKIGFFEGYTQCQEDMADMKYTIKEVERYHDIRATQGIKNANNYINSLNKKD